MKQKPIGRSQGIIFMKNAVVKTLTYLLFLLLIPVTLLAQSDSKDEKSKTPKLKLSGSLGASQNFFNYSSNDTFYTPYRSPSQTMLFANAQLSVGKFSMPFNISYMVQSKVSQYSTPIPANFRLKDLVNNYNNLSFNPTYKNLTANLGTQVPKYSELTCGSLPLFGGGFLWKPKKFRLAAFYGISQPGVSTDSNANLPGSYKRTSAGFKIGYGMEERSHFYVIALKHMDDKNSANVTTTGVHAMENAVTSLDGKLCIGSKFFVQGEMAISALSVDLEDDALESDSFELNIPRWLTKTFKPRLTSRYGLASTAAIGYAATKWGAKISGKLYTSDYHTLNFPFLQTDRLEILVEPYVKLFKERVGINVSAGRRIDNLLENKTSTTYQDLYSVNTSFILTKNWTLGGTFSNFGMRNTVVNDTFRLQNINNNISVNSSYIIRREKTSHTFIGSFNLSKFKDYNVVSGAFADNNTRVYVGGYSIAFAKTPLTINLTDAYMENKIYAGQLKVNTVSASVGYPFGKEKNLNTTVQGNFMNTALDEYSADKNSNISVMLSYIFKKKLNLGANGTYNFYKYGTRKPGVNYTENSIRLFASYSF
ncbi:MAG: hypothetical protein GC181_10230 [Bacteroidetes bacterium]|nr:hypothetical protein [Bacteroidota bacterium]